MRRSIGRGLLVLAIALAWAPHGSASAQATTSDGRLTVGQPLPVLEGDYLSGGDARLPKDVAGQVAILALGFSYESRLPVEAWVSVLRNRLSGRSGWTWLQIPMIGGAGRLARPFISRGMRRDTPADEQRHVVMVFGLGDWKRRLDVKDETAAHLVLLDRAGVVRWLSVQRTVSPEVLGELLREIDRHLGPAPPAGQAFSRAGG
jgi:hypothetical protein